MSTRMIEERDGFAGALRASGGLGGPVAAPHLDTSGLGGPVAAPHLNTSPSRPPI